MGWFIALGIIGTYIGVGLTLVPSLVRSRWRYHEDNGSCSAIGCYRSDSDKAKRSCSADWAAWAWMLWPFISLVTVPRSIASGTMAKDKAETVRIKALEKENEARAERDAREVAILRASDPSTMTMMDFQKQLDAASKATAPKPGAWVPKMPWS